MNKTIAAITLLLAACTDPVATDTEIHEVVMCDGSWAGHLGIPRYSSCEAPCADLQQLGSRESCFAAERGCAAGHFSDWMGREGCCVISRDGGYQVFVTFAECEVP